MVTNLDKATIYEGDPSSSDAYNASLKITRSGEVEHLQRNVVVDDVSKTSNLMVDRVLNVRLKRLVSSESIEFDDDDTGSIGSTNSGYVCARIPTSLGTSMSDDDPDWNSLVDRTFFYPLSQRIENKNMPLTHVYVESSIKPTYEPTAPMAGAGTIGSYSMLRATYLLVTLVIMLADGLQGKS